ncbi:hypothetical protein GCM10010116_50490 [Microbispora rosea subsp. aerata]|nr:hypothetical protein GCM10010116_50490 [Microbispora rosea subsp. aerata]GLJ85230.1 hypothetical protein GCM10017588_39590 [Microbispora rosea subsp. aerata]
MAVAFADAGARPPNCQENAGAPNRDAWTRLAQPQGATTGPLATRLSLRSAAADSAFRALPVSMQFARLDRYATPVPREARSHWQRMITRAPSFSRAVASCS